MRQIILDTETTGLDPQQGHRITEIGCIELYNREKTGNTFQCYINPEREVDAGAVAITGLTTEFLQEKPLFAEIAADFLAFVRDAEVIIHNAAFDVGFINAELRRLSMSNAEIQQEFTQYVSVTDTLLMARERYPGQRNNLDALCKRLGVNNQHRQLHGALLDASLLAEVYLAMTAGQTTLQLTSAVKQEQDHSQQLNTVLSAQIQVHYATPDEVLTHQARLVQLNQSVKGACLWQKLENAEAESAFMVVEEPL